MGGVGSSQIYPSPPLRRCPHLDSHKSSYSHREKDEESEFLNHVNLGPHNALSVGNADGTLQNKASHPQSYKINNGVRVPRAKAFLSPPTCIFLTAEQDGGLLLIVPRPTPLGPGGRALSHACSLWMGLCLWKFLPLQADRSPYVDH